MEDFDTDVIPDVDDATPLERFDAAVAALWACPGRASALGVLNTPRADVLDIVGALVHRQSRGANTQVTRTAAVAAMYLTCAELPGSGQTYLSRARAHMREVYRVDPNPVGLGNSKVGGPSTYRPTSGTCPSTCAYFKDCYAHEGRVSIANARSSADLMKSAASVVLGAHAARREGKQLRLHTSGDFFVHKDGVDVGVDRAYVEAVCVIGWLMQYDTRQPLPKYVRGHWAWTYTHVPQASFRLYAALLRDAGVAVAWSDHLGPEGAVIWEHSKLDELQDQLGDTAVAFACPAQTTVGVSCARCGACSALEGRGGRPGRVVVFDPHGAGASKVMSASRKTLTGGI